MKFLDLNKLSLLNIKSNKFKSIIYSLVMLILFLLISITFTGTSSIFKFFDKYLNSNYDFRTIEINIQNDDREKIIKNIENQNIKEIQKIFPNSDYLLTFLDIEQSEIPNISKLDVKNASISAYVISQDKKTITFETKDLKTLNDSSVLNYKVTKGRDILNANEIVCSSKFYPNILHDPNDIINLNDYIGKKINISYSKRYFPKSGDTKILETYNEQYTLVGTYNIDELLNDLYVCFINNNEVIKINDLVKPVYEDKVAEENSIKMKNIILLVDKYENVDNVLQKISNLGYDAQKKYELDTEIYDLSHKILKYVTGIITIISLFIVYLFIKNIINENKSNIKLYRLIGYNNKNIKKIFIIEYLFLTFIVFILHLGLMIVLKSIAIQILNNYPDLFVLKIRLDFSGSLIFLLFISVYIVLIFNLKFKKESMIV